MSESSLASFEIPVEAAYFAGHFPGDPMVPGAKLIDLVLAELTGAGAISAFPVEIASTKFIAPVRPGATVVIQWRSTGTLVQFECSVDGARVASGSLRTAAE